MQEQDESGVICVEIETLVRVGLAALGLVTVMGLWGCGDVLVTAPTPTHVHSITCGHGVERVVIVDRAPEDRCDRQTLLPVPGC